MTTSQTSLNDSSDLVVEFHLATFSVAIALALTSTMPTFNSTIDIDTSQNITSFSPRDIINEIASQTKFFDRPDFYIDEVCLAQGLVLYIKYLNSTKGFGLCIRRVHSKKRNVDEIPALGILVAQKRNVEIYGNLISYDLLRIRYGEIQRRFNDLEKSLMRLITLIKDELLNSRGVNNEFGGKDYCSKLSDVCSPKAFYKLLHDNQRILAASNSSKAEIEELRITSSKYNSSLQNTLNKELDALREVLWRTYGRRSINISNHSEFANEFADTIWEKCVRDVCIAPTWFRILFYGSLSNADIVYLEKKGNSDLIDALEHGHKASNEMLTNRRSDVSSIRQAAMLRQKELFADMILHILLHCKCNGQCPLEWIYKISSILKDGGLSDSASNNLSRIALGYSAVVARDISETSLPTFYDQRMRLMVDMIAKTSISDTKEYKSYIWILMIDNYAKVKYAAEQTGKKAFASTTDSLSILAFPTTNEVLIHELVKSRQERVSLCTSLNNLQKVKVVIAQGYIDLSEIFIKSEDINNRFERIDTNFAHLSDAFAVASLPVKSSSHEQMLQVFKILIDYLFDSGSFKSPM